MTHPFGTHAPSDTMRNAVETPPINPGDEARETGARTLRLTLDIKFRPMSEEEEAGLGPSLDIDEEFEPDDPTEWDAAEIAELVSGYLEATEDDDMFAGTGLFVRREGVQVVSQAWKDATLPPVEEAAAVPGGAADLRQRIRAILEKDRPVAAFKTCVDGSPVVRDGETDFITAKAAKAAVEDIWNDINAALTASEAVGTVPREPTLEMRKAGLATLAWCETFAEHDRDRVQRIFRAMWDAAQSSAPTLAGENVEAEPEHIDRLRGELGVAFSTDEYGELNAEQERRIEDAIRIIRAHYEGSRQAPKDGTDG